MRNPTSTIHGIENPLKFGLRDSIQHPWWLCLISLAGSGLQPEPGHLGTSKNPYCFILTSRQKCAGSI
ncbi:MAG: hypothetical protein NUV74_19270 [Candidatus Brocadiaceae bacterium]|nr:hypothetical protein [Candidatus Brocadiaceae bacterium]